MKVEFTEKDLQDAIEKGIFDDNNNTTANPTQVIRYFERWATVKAKQAHRDARHEAVDIITQQIHSQESIEASIDGEIVIVEETRILKSENEPSLLSQIMNIKF